MFCSDCGSKANGKFCWNCGCALHGGAAADVVALPLVPPPGSRTGDELASIAEVEIVHQTDVDWSQEIRYDVLRKHLAVQRIIAQHAAMAPTRISGEKFLEMCTPLAGGVPLDKVGTISQSLYSAWGIGTGESRSIVVPRPAGVTLVALLCSLARRGEPIKQVDQATDGCVIQAELPSDLWSLAGNLVTTLQRVPEGTRLEATTRIGGQWLDWGKSRRALDNLFADVASLPIAA